MPALTLIAQDNFFVLFAYASPFTFYYLQTSYVCVTHQGLGGSTEEGQGLGGSTEEGQGLGGSTEEGQEDPNSRLGVSICPQGCCPGNSLPC